VNENTSHRFPLLTRKNDFRTTVVEPTRTRKLTAKFTGVDACANCVGRMRRSLLAQAALIPLLVILVGSCRGSSTGPSAGGLRERWYQSQTGSSRSRPAINGTTVYFGTGDGQIIARDVNSGAQLWAAKVSQEAIEGANLIVRTNVVVAASVFHTTGVDALTGRELWRYESPKDTVGAPPGGANPGSLIDSRLDADNQMVYIPAWGASVSAIDLGTGAVRWVWHPGVIAGDTATSGVFSSGSMGVKVSGDTVFSTLWHATNRAVGTSEAWLVALDRNTGAEFWRVRMPFQGSGVLIQAAPALYQNLVIVHTLSARTYAIDRSTQRVVWEYVAPGATLSTNAGPEILGDILYVDGGDGQIYALRAADGTIVWKGMYGLATGGDLLVTDRHIIFPSGAELHVLDRQTGNQLVVAVQPHTSDPLFASPAASANGLVYITVANAAWCFEDP
jgi:outer membrane protein assembly factor BamB